MLLLHIIAAASAAPTLFWSSDAAPGETLLVGKSGPCRAPCAVVVKSTGSNEAIATLAPSQVNNASIMVALPASLPLGAYSVTAGGSVPLTINAPDLWWVHGDAGNTSSSSGWLRVFGRSLTLGAPDDTARRLAALAAAEEMAKAARRGDLAAVSRIGAEQAAATAAAVAKSPTLLLSNAATDEALAPIAAANASSVEATFLFAAVPPGTYNVKLSNGYATSALDSFVSPQDPHVRSLTVVSSASVAFAEKVFAVADYGCAGGVNRTAAAVNCSAAVYAAIAAAGASAGGGTVLFGIGRWYLDGPLLLPQGVLLKGVRMDLTSLYFNQNTCQPGSTAMDNNTCVGKGNGSANTAPLSLIAAAAGASRFGAEDLAIYVLSYYQNVVDIGPETVGVRFRRVRIRANAFHCQARSSEGGPGSGRAVPWTFHGGGFNPLFWIHGHSFEVSDCDLWSTWSVFHSNGGGPGRYGLMARNQIYNGGSCHWFDNGRELIFESNTCIGNNPMSMGNNVDTYGGGYAHHVYIGSNHISQIWGNDRETMTYDNAGNAYFGAIASTSADGTKLTIPKGFDPKSHSYTDKIEGGAMVVISGAGAGQYRRVVDWPAAACHNRSCAFTINSKLDAPLDASSVVEVMPFRGKNIFHRTSYNDVGAFQFYGIGVDNQVVGMTMARGGGFAAWGQNRGAPPWTGETVSADAPPATKGFGFVNPNLMNVFHGNQVLEGLRAEHQGSPLGTGGWGDGLQFSGHVFAIQDARPDLNRFIVFRNNSAMSNGGFYIGGSSDVLLEGNKVSNTPKQSVSGQEHYHVTADAVATLLVHNA